MLHPPSRSRSWATQTPLDTDDAISQGQTRPALRMIQAVPLNKRPKPVTITNSPFDSIAIPKSIEPPTPPATPLQRRHKRSSTSAGSISLEKVNEETVVDAAAELKDLAMVAVTGIKSERVSWGNTIPRAYTGQYRRCGNGVLDNGELGRGVWSVVYRSVEESLTYPAPLLTPPTSPTESSSPIQSNKVLAIKAPSRKDAHKILDHEARILTYLHSFPDTPDHVVPFYGYDQSSHSIILSAIPLNLDVHVKAAAKTARANFSTRTMFDPVVGIQEWQSLATALISGLCFLQSHQCIHGDIKPANILLQPSDGDKSYTPFYCDFSSALVTTDPAPSEITALTQDYSSPELLTSLTDTTRPTFPTPAADVYALAVTLLFAAIGESPYAAAKMEVMKLSMAREGRPLQFAKSGEQAARVRTGGLVERCLAGALAKDAEARWEVTQWADEVEKLIRSMSTTQRR